MICLQPVNAGWRRGPGTPVSNPAPHPPSPVLPPSPSPPKQTLQPQLPVGGNPFPQNLTAAQLLCLPPRQQPSLTRSLPLLAFSLTLTPSAGAETLPEWTAGWPGGGGGGHAKSGAPKQQSFSWEPELLGTQESEKNLGASGPSRGQALEIWVSKREGRCSTEQRPGYCIPRPLGT